MRVCCVLKREGCFEVPSMLVEGHLDVAYGYWPI